MGDEGSRSNCTLTAAKKRFEAYNEQFEAMNKMHVETHKTADGFPPHYQFTAVGVCYTPDWKTKKASGWKYTTWTWDTACIPLNAKSTTTYTIYGDGKDVHPDFVKNVQTLANYTYADCTLTGFSDLKCYYKGGWPGKA